MAKKTLTLPVDRDKQKIEAAKLRARWMRELENSKQHEKDWTDRAKKVVARYRDERDLGDEDTSSRFNILYANTEILKGSTYAKPPIPIVRRRWDSQNPAGVIAARILERAISYNNECVDLDDTLKQCVEDMYLPGRAVARVKYTPTLVEDTQRKEVLEEDAYDDSKPPVLKDGVQKDDKGYYTEEAFERVVYEKAPVDYIDWKWFRYSKAPTWKKVRWVAFGDLLTRDDCISTFGKTLGRKIKLNWRPDAEEGEEKDPADARAVVWTIWNKPDRRIYVVSEGYEDGVLLTDADPLKLENFFPMPEPLYDIRTNGSLVPIPNFCTYQDQANELDELTTRITRLVEAMKRRGVYDATMTELEQLQTLGDNKFIPITNLTALREKGGLEQVFMSEPVAQLAQVLLNLYQQRDQCKSIIYEITGISDIVRGQSKASETLGAQQLKAQYASVRIKQRQNSLQRFALQLMRLQGEIISEHFSQETLAAMTGVKIPTGEQKAQAIAQHQAATAQAQMAGQPVPPPPPEAQMPSWDDIMKILRDDKMRGFNLEIETDSTIAVNEADEQEAAVKMVGALGQIGSQVAPAVQMGFIPKEAAKAIVKFAVRKFRASREVEESLDAQTEEQPQADPKVIAKQQEELQKAGEKLQTREQQLTSTEQQIQKAGNDLALKESQFNNEVANQKIVDELASEKARLQYKEQLSDIQMAMKELQLEQQKLAAAAKAAQDHIKHKLDMAQERADAKGEGNPLDPDAPEKPTDIELLAESSAQMIQTLGALIEQLGKPKTVTMPSGKTATIETMQ